MKHFINHMLSGFILLFKILIALSITILSPGIVIALLYETALCFGAAYAVIIGVIFMILTTSWLLGHHVDD